MRCQLIPFDVIKSWAAELHGMCAWGHYFVWNDGHSETSLRGMASRCLRVCHDIKLFPYDTIEYTNTGSSSLWNASPHMHFTGMLWSRDQHLLIHDTDLHSNERLDHINFIHIMTLNMHIIFFFKLKRVRLLVEKWLSQQNAQKNRSSTGKVVLPKAPTILQYTV